MRNYNTAYATLDKIASIPDREKRKEALREELTNNNALAIAIQYTYHPNVNFRLPPGPLPASIARKSKHDEKAPFYYGVRRLKTFMYDHVEPKVLERNFINLYEEISTEDADLLIGIKDKKLPWDTLDGAFVYEALPELFPEGFKENEPVEIVETPPLPDVEDVPEGIPFSDADAQAVLEGTSNIPVIAVGEPVKRKRGRPKKVKE